MVVFGPAEVKTNPHPAAQIEHQASERQRRPRHIKKKISTNARKIAGIIAGVLGDLAVLFVFHILLPFQPVFIICGLFDYKPWGIPLGWLSVFNIISLFGNLLNLLHQA